MEVIKKYLWNVLIAIDQFANAIMAGDPDETISSRFGKWMYNAKEGTLKHKIAFFFCMILYKLNKDHCKNAIEEDEGKDDLVKNMEVSIPKNKKAKKRGKK